MTNNNIVKFEQIIKASGYRSTRARRDAFKLLMNAEPLSIGQLLRKSKGNMDRVSLYRNMELFEKLGIVHRIYIGWKYKIELSDSFIEHHHHLSCLSCGKIIDIEDEKHIDSFIEQVAKDFNFKPRKHLFEIDGYCKACY